jgi:hypothetical protein
MSGAICLVVSCARVRVHVRPPTCRCHYLRARQGRDLDAPIQRRRPFLHTPLAAMWAPPEAEQHDQYTPPDPSMMAQMMDSMLIASLLPARAPPPPPPKQVAEARLPLGFDAQTRTR